MLFLIICKRNTFDLISEIIKNKTLKTIRFFGLTVSEDF